MLLLTGKALQNSKTYNKGYKTYLKKLAKYGIAISKDTFTHLWDTDAFLEEVATKFLKEGEDSRTLFLSWDKVANAALEELYFDTIIHYMRVAIFSEDLVLPEEFRKITKYSKLTVIEPISKREAKKELRNLLYKNISYDIDTLEMILKYSSLLDIDIDITKVKNKELEIKLLIEKDIIPSNAEQFFRKILYPNLLIKNKFSISRIKEITPSLKDQVLTDIGLEKLSEDFYRFKPLFLALKDKFSRDVNKIRRLAVKNHKPKVIPDYLQLTSKELSEDNFLKIIKKMDTSYLLKLYRAFKIREENPVILQYRIRNGATWVKTNRKNYKNIDKITFIFEEIKNRVLEKIEEYDYIYMPKNLDIALPQSGKNFVFDYPVGTKLKIESSKELITGIYWENLPKERVDLDFSMINTNVKIGWNGEFRRDSILFSGDITSAPKGATELFFIPSLYKEDFYFLKVNTFTKNTTPVNFKFFFGSKKMKADTINKESMSSIKNIHTVLSLKTDPTMHQANLGFLMKDCFIFTNENSVRHISNLVSEDLVDFAKKSITSYLMFSDIIPKEKITHNRKKKGDILYLDNRTDILKVV
jgi:hypothetical protein